MSKFTQLQSTMLLLFFFFSSLLTPLQAEGEFLHSDEGDPPIDTEISKEKIAHFFSSKTTFLKENVWEEYTVARSAMMGVDMYWIGAAGTGDFNDPANWSTTDPTTSTTVAISPPSAQDDIYFVDASFPTAGNYTINCTGTQNVRHIRFQGLGSATAVSFAGSGALNHYGDISLLSDTRLTMPYAGTMVETFNTAFSPSRRVYDLQGVATNVLVVIRLPSTDTVDIVSEFKGTNQFQLNHGTLLAHAPIQSSIFRISWLNNVDNHLIRFEGNGQPISASGKLLAGVHFAFLMDGLAEGIDTVMMDETDIIHLSNNLRTQYATTLPYRNFGLKSIKAADPTHSVGVDWVGGTIGAVKGASWILEERAMSIDTLEHYNISNTNFGNNAVVKLKKLLYPTPGCGEYVRYAGARFSWQAGLPASANAAGDTLRQFSLSNCYSLDAAGTVLTGGDQTQIFDGKDELLNQGFEFVESRLPRNMYWIGGTGDWNDINHWSLTSGGAPLSPSACPPTYLDDVFFDANSFTANGETMTMTGPSECHNMTWDNLAFTDIDWLGNIRMDLYGSMILDVNMTKNIAFDGGIHLWGKQDSIFFELGSENARYMPVMDLVPRKYSHYDITTYAYFDNIYYGSDGNSGSPTYLSFADTVECRNLTGGTLTYTRPGGLDTIDMDKNSTKWLYNRGGSTWAYRAAPRILHNPTSQIIVSSYMGIYQTGSNNCTFGRFPNTLLQPGARMESRFSSWTCMDYEISGYSADSATTQSTYTLFNANATTGGINCINFRTTDTLVNALYIGKNPSALTIRDSLVFERVGTCLDKNVLSGATANQSGLYLENPDQVRMTGTEIIRFNYRGINQPFDATIHNFDGGGLSNFIFGPNTGVTTYYWRKNPVDNSYNGDWEKPNNWTLDPNDEFGQGPLGCAPSAADSVVIDMFSSDGGSYTINASNPFSCLAFDGQNAASGLTVTGNGNFTLGGSFLLNDNLNWGYSGDMFVNFDGDRTWAVANKAAICNNLFFNGPGTMKFDGTTSQRIKTLGRIDLSGGTGALDFNAVPYISTNGAIYAPNRTITAIDCPFFEVRGSYGPGFTGSARGIDVGDFVGDGTNIYIRYDGFGNNFSGTFETAYFQGGPIYAVGAKVLEGASVEVGTAAIFNGFKTKIQDFIANGTDANYSVTWNNGGPDTISNAYTSLPNTIFENRVTLGNTMLSSDRTHTFPANDTTFFLENADLAKIGDLSKVITFRSTSTGSNAFLHKPLGGNIYMCNIDARDVTADVAPNSQLFRTNDLSVLNNSPGWDIVPTGGADNITSWDTMAVTLFRGDSTFIGFSWDANSQGPYRVVYEEQGFGQDSIQVNDGILNKQIRFGGYRDSLLLGQTVSKHFECPGIFIPDSVNANLDTVLIHVPETENGLSSYDRGGKYLYKNLATWVYMMDSIDYLTTAAFYDKTSPTDQDSLGNVTTKVDGQATTIISADRYYVPRTFEMTSENSVPSRVRLFFSKAEVEAMKTIADFTTPASSNPSSSNPNASADTDFLATLTLGSYPNGQLFDQAAETTIPTFTTGVASEVDSNTYFVEFDATMLQSFALYRSCIDTTEVLDTICANTTYDFNNQMLGTAGIYFDTLMQTSGCDSIIKLDLFVRPENVLSSTTTQPSCNGGANGAIDLSVSGTGTYTYNWSNGSTNQDLNNIAAGTYDVTVTDEHNCMSTASIILTEPTAINPTTVVTNVDCNGNSTGAIDLSVSGGTAGYTYLWSNGETTEDITGLTPNTYTVTVTDANSCTKTVSATVSEPVTLVCNIVGMNPTVSGMANGSADASVTGGTAPFTYLWSDGQTVEDAVNLAAGTYTLTVTDANSCTSTCSVTLTEPGALSCTLAGTNLTCNGNSSGAIVATIDGGTAPFTYAWSSGQTTKDLASIPAGTYTLTVTDNASATSTCNITITEPSAIAISFTQTNVTCNGTSTGAIDLTVSGGTGAHTFAWSNSATTEDVTGLAAGTYTVTVSDANSCTKEEMITITEPTVIALNTTKVDVNCKGDATGSIDLTVSGGTPGYLYNWSHGPATEDVSDLAAGTYTVTVTDDNSCTQTTSVTINEPTDALSLSTTQTNVDCNGNSTGAIDLTVMGGTTAYTYAWSNSATTEDISGLAAGTYKVIVTDGNSCKDSIEVTITEPMPLVATGVKTNIDCNGNTTGAIDLTPMGGTTAYTYLWSTGATTEDLTGLAAGSYTVTLTDANSCTSMATFQITEPATGTPPAAHLCASTANVFAFDFNNKTYEIVRENKSWADAAACAVARGGNLAIIDDQAENDEIQQQLINNAYINSANTTAPDGGGGAYAWIGGSDSNTEGTWIWDANNDGTGTTFFMGDAFSGSAVGGAYNNWGSESGFSNEPDNFNGNQNAAAMAITVYPQPDPGAGARLGNPGEWNDLDPTNTLYYIVEYPSTKIPFELTASVTVDSNATCNGAMDGGLTANAIEGAAPYTYLWSNAATTASISGIGAGTYNVTVTDRNGCEAMSSGMITEPTAIDTTEIAAMICDGATYDFNNQMLDMTGIYLDTFPSQVNGCDSLIRLTLTVNPIDTTDLTETICSNETYPFNGQMLDMAGVYLDTLAQSNTCDSIIRLTLMVNPVDTTDITETICSNDNYTFNGQMLDMSGVYLDTLAQSNTCDSIVRLTLTVNPVDTTDIAETICEGATHTFNGQMLAMSGIYLDTLAQSNACDSIIRLTLTVNPVDTTDLAETICGNETYPFNGQDLDMSGVYLDTLAQTNACDSIIRLTLTVNPVDTTDIAETICSNETYPFNGQNLDMAGIYLDTLAQTNTCDSIIRLTLMINPVDTTELKDTIVNGETYTFNGQDLDMAGIYLDTLAQTNTCDSIIRLMLTVNNVDTTDIAATICSNEVYPFNNQDLNTAGTYLDTLQTQMTAVDSIIRLTLMVNSVDTTDIAAAICPNMTYNFNNQDLNTSGIYLDTLMQTNGCDSIIRLTLDVSDTTPPVAVCKDTTIYLAASGTVHIDSSFINNGSSDNCGALTMTLDKTSFDCSNVNGNTVQLTVTDVGGNTDMCTATVTVLDTIKPTVVCKDINIVLDANGMATIAEDSLDNGSTDNCAGVLTFDTDVTTFSCADIGTKTLKLIVTDANGNVDSCTATATISDDSKPTLVCNAITVDLDMGSCTDTLQAADLQAIVNGSTDNCTSTSNPTANTTTMLVTDVATGEVRLHASYGDLTVSTAGFAFDDTNVGANTIKVYLADANGNMDSCDVVVTVVDTFPAMVVCKDITVHIDANGMATIAEDSIDNGSADACGAVTFDTDITTFGCADLGTKTLTLVVTDVNGNKDSCTATATIIDTIQPMADCKNINVYLDAAGTASIAEDSINNNSTDNCSTLTFDTDITTFSCADVGTKTVKLVVTDGSGNKDSCTAVVTVLDTIKPVVACNNFTVQLPISGMASITTAEVDNASADACGIDTMYLDTYNFTCSDVGANSIVLTVVDNNGNTSTCTATITVEDNVDPVAMCKDSTLYVNAAGAATLTAQDLYAGSFDSCGIQSMVIDQTNFVCSDVGTVTVTLTLTDNNNNMSMCTSTITVVDTIKPVATCQNLTIYLDANGAASIAATDLNNGSTDACGIASMTIDQTDFACVNVGANTVTLTVTDVNGNANTCTSTVMVLDTIKPVVACNNFTLQLPISGMASITAAQVNNASADACGIDTMYLDTYNFTCSDVGANSVVLTVIDNNGNTSTCTATITVEDNVDPIAMCKDSTLYLNAAGAANLTAQDLYAGSFDSCGIASMTIDQTDFACSDVGTVTVTLTLTDNNSNVSMCTSTITVVDTIRPIAVCKDSILYLDATGAATLAAADLNNGSSDACGIASRSIDQTAFACANVGANTVTLTVTDVNGNANTCTSTVTVRDTIKPVVACQNITSYLDADGMARITAAEINNGSSDACGIDTMFLDNYEFNCTEVGANTVTLTVEDVNGNQNICTATVTVIDTIMPFAMCKDSTLYLDAAGNASLVALDIYAGSYDSCGIQSMTIDNGNFSCDDLGQNTIVLTLTDVNGNVSMCTSTVTVIDSIRPVVLTKDVTIYLDSFAQATVTVNDIDDGSTDECGIFTLAIDRASNLHGGLIATSRFVPSQSITFTCADLGQNTVELIATDTSLNTNSATAIITVIDTFHPTIIIDPVNTEVDEDDAVTMTTTATGTQLTYQWQENSNAGFVNLVGETANTLSINGVSGDRDGNTFRIIVSDACGRKDTSATALLTVNVARPVIEDPCNCLGNESSFEAGDGQFSEDVMVTSKSGQPWRVISSNGFYKNPTASFPPAGGVGGPYSQVAYNAGDVFTEKALGNGKSEYRLYGIHVDGIGYSISVTDGSDTLVINNKCQYTASCRFNFGISVDGTPGVPALDTLTQNFIMSVNGVQRIDSLKTCDIDKNTFVDDGTTDGLYADSLGIPRDDIYTICPANQWQRVKVNINDFDVAAGDTLYVYEGREVKSNLTPIAKWSGTGVSRTGGWIDAACDPSINASGCLTFNFKTNGDLNKGRGWDMNISCAEREIELEAPNNLSAKLDCEETYAIFNIKPAELEADCGTVQDSQIIRIFSATGELCLDTCLASNQTVNDTFGLGSYLVEYKLKSDTIKSTKAILSVQGASLVCNDKVTIPLGAGCSVFLTPDDLLESTCDTITDTVYYYITLNYVDKNGKNQSITGGGKGGDYPTITKEMLGECGGKVSATIEKRYYEGLDLSFCNNGQQSVECTVEVDMIDQSAPVFQRLAAVDTLVNCNVDLTQAGLGLTTPKAIDNCSDATVTFGGATVISQGSSVCDTSRVQVTWLAADNCGNSTSATQLIVFVRPSLDDIVKTENVTLSCEDDQSGVVVTAFPSIKIGKLKNGVLEPTDTIPLSDEDYICGYILQSRDIAVPATDCGSKIYRYWSVLDWCDSDGGIIAIDTTFIEFKDTLAPQFVDETLENTVVELDHFSCTYDITKVEQPAATDNCSVPTVRIDSVFRIEDGQLWGVPTGAFAQLDCDSFQIRWVAEDVCHEQLTNDTINQIIEIKDLTKPSAVCTDKINLSIAKNEAQLHYRDIDAGSFDACGIAKYEVSRDEISWDSIVIFDCADIHTENKVYLRVTDNKGNQNTCWMLVNVEDKIAPICSDLPDVTGTCDEGHIGDGLAVTDVNENGKMDESEWVDMTAEQTADFNTKYGSPDCSDNVTCQELVIEQQYQFIEKACGIATIKRRYRATDWDGEGRTSNWAEQVIQIETKADWSITLPADWKGQCGDDVPTSEVQITNGACDLMAYEVEEKVFTTIEDACLKVVRTFTIINWCTYEAGTAPIRITRIENEHGLVTESQTITAADFDKVGKLEYTQVLKLQDDTAPVITIEEVATCINSEDCNETKRFAITATDCNAAATLALNYSWTLSSNGTQLLTGTGASFEATVEPKVTYAVRWSVTDNCGNTAREEQTYEFWDCKKPSPFCLNGVAVELMNTGMVQVWATDIERKSFDNCTAEDQLDFRIWHANVGDAPTDLADVQALPKVINFDCSTIGTQTVNLYVIDEEGNWDFCTTYVIVQDNMNACENNEPMAMVSGTILDWKGQTVEEVMVQAMDEMAMMTQENGQYHFELATENDYTIRPEKDENPLNGVSTFDLVLISKHILGITTFENPYQLIAADVNGSGTITAFDMVQIRQLILNINTEFSNSSSWKFVDAAYAFTTNNPTAEAYPQVVTINDLHQNMEVDFVAVKMGDVNGNAKPNSLVQAEERTTTTTFEITTEDRVLKAGERYSVTFTTDQLSDIQGYQFTLGYTNLKAEKLKSGVVGVENFGLHKMDEGMITTSWNGSVGSSQSVQLFTLEFTALSDGKLSEQLSILNRPTAMEAYSNGTRLGDENGNLMEVQLTFTESIYHDQFELFQNQPNPFQNKTTIGFYLPGDSDIELVLRDETGRVLKTIKDHRKAGHNAIQLDQEELTNGFIFYQLSTKFGTQAKKMLKLK